MQQVVLNSSVDIERVCNTACSEPSPRWGCDGRFRRFDGPVACGRRGQGLSLGLGSLGGFARRSKSSDKQIQARCRSGQPKCPIESLAPCWLQVEEGNGALICKGADSGPSLKVQTACSS